MKFPQEWTKILAQGINTPVWKGGYDAVFDPKQTFSQP